MDEYKDEIALEPDVTKPHRIYNKEKEVVVDKNEHKKVGDGVDKNNTILVKKIKMQKQNALLNK